MIQLLLKSSVFVQQLSHFTVFLFRLKNHQRSHVPLLHMRRQLYQLQRLIHFVDQTLKREQIRMRSASIFDRSEVVMNLALETVNMIVDKSDFIILLHSLFQFTLHHFFYDRFQVLVVHLTFIKFFSFFVSFL